MSASRDDPNDWAGLGWRWCARTGAPHLWNVYLMGGDFGAGCVARPPDSVVLPALACHWHGTPPVVVALPPVRVIEAMIPASMFFVGRDVQAELRPGLSGWASLVVLDRSLRGWRRAARAAGVELGPTRAAGRSGCGLLVSVGVRPASVPALLRERGLRVLSSARVVAGLEAMGSR